MVQRQRIALAAFCFVPVQSSLTVADSEFLALEVLPVLWSFSLGPLLSLKQFNAFGLWRTAKIRRRHSGNRMVQRQRIALAAFCFVPVQRPMRTAVLAVSSALFLGRRHLTRV
jgi:hypothetical protein